jgi:hypothetical protein
MATRAEAIALKPQVRRTLTRLGAVIVSIGVEDTKHGARLAVGVDCRPDELTSDDLTIEHVPVHLFEQHFGTLS